MKPIHHFNYCPQCGQRRADATMTQATDDEKAFVCPICQFTYYFNPANAAGAFIQNQAGEVLFIRRAREPAKGRLAIPGGFVDPGETAEAALRREVREEVNIEVDSLDYLCTQPNEYPYKGVTYPVLDLFFTARAVSGANPVALDGVASCAWMIPAEVSNEDLAFPSIRAAWALYLRKRGASVGK